MGIVRSQSLRSSILIYIGMLIGYLNLIILMPRFFTPEQIGMTRTIIVISYVLTIFSDLGATPIMYRFFPIYSKRNATDFLFIVLLLPMAGFFLTTGITFIFQDVVFFSIFEKCPPFKEYLFLIYLTTFFTLITGLGTNYCALHLKTIIPRSVAEILPRLGNTILILLFAFNIISFNTYFILFAMLVGMAALFIWGYVIYIQQFKFEFKLSPITKRVYKKMLIFGFVGILGNSFSTIVNYIDTLMLAGINGQQDVAIFNIGYYIISIISVPYLSIMAVVTPLLAKAIRFKRWHEVLKYYQQTSLNNMIIGSFIFVLLLISFDDLLQLLPENQGYDKAIYIVLFLGIGRIIDMMTGCNSEIIAYSKYYWFSLYSLLIVSVFCIFSNYFFILHYGIKGVAVSAFISLILFNASRFIYIYTKLKIQPFTNSTAYAIGIILVSSGLTYWLTRYINVHIEDHSFVSAAINVTIKSLLWMVLFLPPIILFNVSEDINKFYNMICARLTGLIQSVKLGS